MDQAFIDPRRSARKSWLASRWRGLRRLLGRRLRLTGHGLGLRIVLEPAAPSRRKRRGSRRLPVLGRKTLNAMLKELADVLDRHPQTRAVMPALTLVERALRQPDGSGIERLAPEVLIDAARHLDRLLDNTCGSALELLSEHLRLALDTLSWPDTDADSGVQIAESSMTMFVQAEQEWDERQTAPEVMRGH